MKKNNKRSFLAELFINAQCISKDLAGDILKHQIAPQLLQFIAIVTYYSFSRFDADGNLWYLAVDEQF